MSSNIDVDEDTIPSQDEMSSYQMIGDVNLFFKRSPEGDEEVEAEVMVAGITFTSKFSRLGKS